MRLTFNSNRRNRLAATQMPRARSTHDVAPSWRKRAGFTLLEMLLVVLIIGVLGSLIVPRLLPQSEAARVKVAEAEVQANVPAALDLFMLNVGRYPTSEEGLEALWTRPAGVAAEEWRGPYLRRKSVNDPWGRPIRYYCPPRHGGLDFDLVCVGPDGVEDSADDITNAGAQ